MQNYTQYTAVSSIPYEIPKNLGKGALSAKLHGVLECWIIGIVGIKS